MAKTEDFLTNAPKQPQISIDTGGEFPNLKNIPGDSVNEHKNLEESNQILAGDEIRQQNENL